jgi:hypothetical protein
VETGKRCCHRFDRVLSLASTRCSGCWVDSRTDVSQACSPGQDSRARGVWVWSLWVDASEVVVLLRDGQALAEQSQRRGTVQQVAGTGGLLGCAEGGSASSPKSRTKTVSLMIRAMGAPFDRCGEIGGTQPHRTEEDQRPDWMITAEPQWWWLAAFAAYPSSMNPVPGGAVGRTGPHGPRQPAHAATDTGRSGRTRRSAPRRCRPARLSGRADLGEQLLSGGGV